MGIFETIGTVVFLVMVIANSVVIYILFKRIKRIEEKIFRKFLEVSFTAEISEIFSNDELQEEKISYLARKIFTFVKDKFQLKATTYTELIEELKATDAIGDSISSLLIDFFNDLITIQYQEKSLDGEEKKLFKDKTIIIAKKLEALS
ncbi:hypothetical protein K9M79_06780 [Candidatus Woesearchaeota archaeon]|nr:hypothetical protein [Candidatus Woesearchaeota archaeon]